MKIDNPLKYKYKATRGNAQHRKIPFNLTYEEYCSIPMGLCPIFETELRLYDPAPMHNATLDRIDNNKGYELGNVQWMSQRGNDLKSDGELWEFKLILLALEKLKESNVL